MPALRPKIARLAFAALVLLAAQSALAVDYFADNIGGPWDANTTWHIGSTTGPNPTAGVFPGSSPGDRAFLTTGTAPAVTLGVPIPNPVELSVNCPSCSVTVNSGGILNLTGASAVSVGTMTLNGGGTITGSGSLAIAGGTQLNITGGALDAYTINLQGTATQTGSWAMNNGAQIVIAATGLYDIQTIRATSPPPRRARCASAARCIRLAPPPTSAETARSRSRR